MAEPVLPSRFGSLDEARAATAGYRDVELDPDALIAAALAVEDVLIEFRDDRLSVMGRGNGFVIREKDGKESSIMRLATKDGIAIAIRAYLKVTGND